MPAAARAAVSAAKFVVCLEQRETELTRMADVVFPVATVSEKSGHVRELGGPDPVASRRSSPTRRRCPTCGCSPRIAEALGKPIGFRTPAEVRSDMEALGPWEGARADVPLTAKAPARKRLAKGEHGSWPPGSRCSTTARCSPDEAYLAATARPAVARLSEADLAALGNRRSRHRHRRRAAR
ncbi:MAG: hypothetical protein V9F00_16920 [Nocardioides sp.]